MKKTTIILSAVVMATVMLYSCGGGESKEEGESNEVSIGNQIWMTQNLNVDKFRNGDPIPEAKTKEEWQKAGENGQPAWCYYDNDPANGEKYGKLYNWYAVNDPRGLAPKGWKIPSDEDWSRLSDFLGGEDVAGTKMKSNSGWKEKGNGTNESGFSALPGGFRYENGMFNYIGKNVYWWSFTEYNSDVTWRRSLFYGNSSVSRYYNNNENGLYVRCLKETDYSESTTFNNNVSKEVAKSNEVEIGKQVWMAENLNVDTFRNGDPIPEVKTDNEWASWVYNGKPAWCYYDNDPANGEKYGKLYNWYAVNDPRGLAPEGWKIPSNEDWEMLIGSLGGNEVEGTKMKSTNGWQDDGNGTNESGFSGLPGGRRGLYAGLFFNIGKFGSWWSSYGEASSAYSYELNYNDSYLDRRVKQQSSGSSVRCLRD